ncbi:DNA helicase IV [Agromyces sp. CF514]|uniref:HelD family protein n=1 Tax=Agromyces sp. CF514 TaxID=1881031 RepID=UPI0008E1A417|nr:ATP-binding domain-containing protein [Agromyces sp. CF514]SFR70364.1 DNA helicase IV [Agromyces sp. CF514]
MRSGGPNSPGAPPRHPSRVESTVRRTRSTVITSSTSTTPVAEEQTALDRIREVVAELVAQEAEYLRAMLGRPSDELNLTERDALVAHHSQRLQGLRTASYGLLLGGVQTDDGERYRIGRIGLSDPDDGERLLVDWRAPVARPFYTATPLHRDGVKARRRISSTDRTVTAVYDESLLLEELDGLDGQAEVQDAALLAALDRPRTAHMSDIVGTIQREQDAIIRGPLAGTLVVQGGPGTGKTAVALQRAAYLLYEHRNRLSKSVVLIVGPNLKFLEYISQVLPSLGEDSAVLVTPSTLVPGVTATATESPLAAEFKGRLDIVGALKHAVQGFQVPNAGTRVLRPAGLKAMDLDVRLLHRVRTRGRSNGTPHNEARPKFEKALLTEILRLEDAEHGASAMEDWERRADWAEDPAVQELFDELWPLLDPVEVVRDLFADPARLDEAFPHLEPALRSALLRPREHGLTPADIPLVDELAELLGEDPRPAAAAATRARADRAVDLAYAQNVLDMVEDADADEDHLAAPVSIVTAATLADRQMAGDGRTPAERASADREWVYGHVIVDEAQETSPMLLRALIRRCPTRSMTLVGDANQYTATDSPFTWAGLLDPQVPRWGRTDLTVNYRTPGRIMRLATGVLRRIDAGVSEPASARDGEHEPRIVRVTASELGTAAAREAAEALAQSDGTVGVIAPLGVHGALRDVRTAEAERAAAEGTSARLWIGTPDDAKGLEFDAVVVAVPPMPSPDAVSVATWKRLYVALTRPTQRLTVVEAGDVIG